MKLDKKTLYQGAGLLFAAIFFAWALNNWNVFSGSVGSIFSLFTPIFLGFCIAFVLNVPMRFLEGHILPRTQRKGLRKLRRPLCVLISLCFIIAILVLVSELVVPELINAFTVLSQSLTVFFVDAQEWAMANAEMFPELKEWLAGLELNWAELGKTAFTYVTSSATGLLSGATQFVVALAGGITQTLIAFIFALYMLMDKEHLKQQLSRLCSALLPKKYADGLFFVANLSKRTFASFVTGQCTEACILGVLCWLGMLVFRFPYAPMIGALVGVTALIPIMGAFVGTVVGAFMIVMTGNWVQAIWFVVFLLVLQQIEGNVIYPRVVGSSVGLPSIWVLAAVTVGGSLWGIAGMLFAVPLCSVLYALLRLYVQKRLDTPAPAEQALPKA